MALSAFRRPRSALALALLMSLAFISLGLGVFGLIRNLPAFFPRPEPVDFAAYYAGASILNSTAPYELYNLQLQQRHIEQAGFSTVGGGYIYLPFLAVVLRPLVLLPFSQAAILWLILNLLWLAGSVWLLLDLAGLGKNNRRSAVALILVFLLPPVNSTLVMGQVNIILLFLLAAATCLLVRYPASGRAEILAGLLLGLATALKLFPGIVLLPLIVRCRWRAVGGVLAGLSLALGIGIVWGGGWVNTWRFVVEVLPHIPSPAVPFNQSLLAVMQRLLTSQELVFSVLSATNYVTVTSHPLVDLPVLVYPATWLLSLAILGTTAWAIRRAIVQEMPVSVDMALTLLMVLLVLPLVWKHYHVFILLPLAILSSLTPQDIFKVTIFMQSLLLLSIQRYTRVLSIYGIPLWISFGFLAILLIWGYACYTVVRHSRHEATV